MSTGFVRASRAHCVYAACLWRRLMERDLCGERSVQSPDADSLASGLRECGSGDDFFAVVEGDDGGFVQTTGRVAEGFVLEYRDASSGQFYRCMD